MGLVRTQKESELASSTHFLERAEIGIGQDINRN